MFRVLRPYFERTDETFVVEGKTVHYWRLAKWIEIGRAKDIQDAKRRYGGSPVLEAIEGTAQ